MTNQFTDEQVKRAREAFFSHPDPSGGHASMRAALEAAGVAPQAPSGSPGTCDACGGPATHITTPGAIRFCDDCPRRPAR